VGPAPEVVSLEATQDSEAAEVLGRAFVNDPPLRAMLRHVTDPAERSRILGVVFGVALARQRAHRQPVFGIVREGKVVAVAISEGVGHRSNRTPPHVAISMLARMIAAAGLSGTLRAMRLSWQMSRKHPSEPHLYLSVLGVDPDYQGQHYGIRLLNYLTWWVGGHPEWSGIYLETATQANVRYYARAGYRLLGEMRPLGVTMWRMMQPRVAP
jgi:GNAT superfamily N-acetyltransferase